MPGKNANDGANTAYYLHVAAAFVRGRLDHLSTLPDDELVALGQLRGLRLHKFKRTVELSRVKRVLGILRALGPGNLLDIGSGRGTFLWPLVDTFPHMEITAIDLDSERVADIESVRQGGFRNLRALQMDATTLQFEANGFDVVTVLEVLEHLPAPHIAAAECVRVARQFVVSSVPSKADDNPGHLRLFTRASLESLWLAAGATSVKVEYVLNHMIAVAKV